MILLTAYLAINSHAREGRPNEFLSSLKLLDFVRNVLPDLAGDQILRLQ